jgi:hypothetical protein
MLDAVARGLQRGDAEGALGVFLVGGRRERRLLGDVEELADGDLPAHQGVDLPRGCRVRAAQSLLEQVVAPGDEEIAEQDRRGSPERRAVARPAGLACAASSARCAAGCPRRVSELSMMSSWTSAAAWNTSSAAAASSTASGTSLTSRVDARHGQPSRDAEARAQTLSPARVRVAASRKTCFGAGIRPREALRCTNLASRWEMASIGVGGSVHGPSLVLDLHA